MHLIQIPATADQSGVSPLKKLWPVIAPLLDKSVERAGGATSLDHELTELLALRKQLWVILLDDDGKNKIAGAGISSLQKCPGGLVVANMEMIGGENMKAWFSLKDKFEEWAKAEGCNEIRLFAAKGWAKHLRDYKITAYVMSKKIDA